MKCHDSKVNHECNDECVFYMPAGTVIGSINRDRWGVRQGSFTQHYHQDSCSRFDAPLRAPIRTVVVAEA